MALRIIIALSLFASCMTQACIDMAPQCPQLGRLCSSVAIIRSVCPRTCKLCLAPPTQAPPPPVEPTGPAPPCGRPAVAQSRVIAGDDAKPGAWPWQIGMFINNRFACGGSLVSHYWIVTAAHCVDRIKDPSAYTVVLGAQDLRNREPSWQVHRVAQIIIHPNWGRLNNDIALMRLAKPAQLNTRVRTVCLPDTNEVVKVGTKCYITGWGKIKHPGTSHPILQQAVLPVVSNSECQKLNGKSIPIKISDKMVCAGYGPASPKSGCHGDSGGPFVCPTGPGGAFQLHGDVSWGSATCEANKSYTVFARTTALRSFIHKHTGL